eukprot:TRINITY_DN751_c0_g2_i1.p1 TRINITY_DN751_c0_g2~~TRINITY_DN751_c0_g2_i1.p1  ORF type:complete len:411 (-),score=183.91 TRINITY_DN751_c0_g2_i1:137-1303(-)
MTEVDEEFDISSDSTFFPQVNSYQPSSSSSSSSSSVSSSSSSSSSSIATTNNQQLTSTNGSYSLDTNQPNNSTHNNIINTLQSQTSVVGNPSTSSSSSTSSSTLSSSLNPSTSSTHLNILIPSQPILPGTTPPTTPNKTVIPPFGYNVNNLTSAAVTAAAGNPNGTTIGINQQQQQHIGLPIGMTNGMVVNSFVQQQPSSYNKQQEIQSPNNNNIYQANQQQQNNDPLNLFRNSTSILSNNKSTISPVSSMPPQLQFGPNGGVVVAGGVPGSGSVNVGGVVVVPGSGNGGSIIGSSPSSSLSSSSSSTSSSTSSTTTSSNPVNNLSAISSIMSSTRGPNDQSEIAILKQKNKELEDMLGVVYQMYLQQEEKLNSIMDKLKILNLEDSK